MEYQLASSPSSRRRSDSSVRENLVFPVLERNEQEHLETLMRRSDDRGLPSEQRHKRWTWGGPPRACEGESEIHIPGGGGGG
ncbi:MAP7 domain-containing protein 2 isoform X3 [Tachysurus ichikawai]